MGSRKSKQNAKKLGPLGPIAATRMAQSIASKNDSPKLGSLKLWLAIAATVSTALGGIAVFFGNIVAIENNVRTVFTKVGLLSASDGIPIRIVSQTTEFAVMGVVSGTAYQEFPFIRVKVGSFTLTGRRSVYIKEIRLGVAQFPNGEADANWAIDSLAPKISVNKTIDADETISVPAQELLIPIDRILDIEKYWLALEVELIVPGKIPLGYVYSHSDRNIFRNK